MASLQIEIFKWKYDKWRKTILHKNYFAYIKGELIENKAQNEKNWILS